MIVWAIGAAAACGGPSPLTHATASSEALAREVLAALAARDASRLAELALDDREFAERVWPELPAARPERNLPLRYVWSDLRQKSDAALERTLAAHGSRRYHLDRVAFRDQPTRYGRYVVHRKAILVVRDISGDLRELHVLGSMIEADGGWKVFSYIVDP